MAPVARHAQLLASCRLRVLNAEREITSATDWNNTRWEKLWLYNLHYFDVLGGKGDPEQCRTFMLRWLAENPPPEGVGWDSYPTSLRIVNWIKWALNGNELSLPMLHSLAIQCRHLDRRIEWHLLGNHLLANAKALVFGGSFFDGPEAARWLKRGLHILEEELNEQILSDGGHFERSPMYHSIVLEDILDLLNVTSAFGVRTSTLGELRQEWCRAVPSMLNWLAAMCHPDAAIAFFNDAAFGVAPEPAALGRYASDLGFERPVPFDGPLQSLPDSGYIRVNAGPLALIFDAAPVGPSYLPGHAHADTLSFELSWGPQRVICNSGTSCYGTGKQREWERSTAAHNTVVVDGQSSSEVWHGFRVARRAYPFWHSIEVGTKTVSVSCSHDGYKRLSGRPVHRREITMREDELMWCDEILGSGMHTICGHIPLHPDIEASPLETRGWELTCRDGTRLELTSMDDVPLRLECGTYAPEFGVVLKRPVITWTSDGTLPQRATFVLRRFR